MSDYTPLSRYAVDIPNARSSGHGIVPSQDVEAFTKGTSKQLECFRLEPAECELVSEDAFLRNPRFRLLQLRHEQVPEFRNLKMIPAAPREIPADIFTVTTSLPVHDRSAMLASRTTSKGQ